MDREDISEKMPKSRSYSDTQQSVEHSHAIIADELRNIAEYYAGLNHIEHLCNLVDYLSEIGLSNQGTSFPPEKSVVDIIDFLISRKLLYRDASSDLKNAGNYETQLRNALRDNSGTPEMLMQYLLGEQDWRAMQERLKQREIKDIGSKYYFRALIKQKAKTA